MGVQVDVIEDGRVVNLCGICRVAWLIFLDSVVKGIDVCVAREQGFELSFAAEFRCVHTHGLVSIDCVISDALPEVDPDQVRVKYGNIFPQKVN